jgi:hypothetical protein
MLALPFSLPGNGIILSHLPTVSFHCFAAAQICCWTCSESCFHPILMFAQSHAGAEPSTAEASAPFDNENK